MPRTLKNQAARRRADQAEQRRQRLIEKNKEEARAREAERKEKRVDELKQSLQSPRRAAEGLKVPGDDQKGLKKLSKDVRNKMGYMNNGGKLQKKLDKLSAKADKKAKKAHDKAEKKGGKVVGTKRVTTAAEPRMLSSKRETVKVYEKEQDVRNKYARKQSKLMDRDYFKGERKKKRKAKKVGSNILQRAAAKSKRRSTGSRSRTGGLLSRTVGRVSERIANKGAAGSKARKRSRGCGKDCQRKIRAGQAGFNK